MNLMVSTAPRWIRSGGRQSFWQTVHLFQQLNSEARGSVFTICGLGDYLTAQKEVRPLRGLSLNPEEKLCFPSVKQQQQQQKWEQLLIVCTSTAADKIRPDIRIQLSAFLLCSPVPQQDTGRVNKVTRWVGEDASCRVVWEINFESLWA